MSSESGDPLADMVDVDELVMAYSARQTASFRQLEGDNDRMLSWEQPVEIQEIPGTSFNRIGIVGDGNCMIHAILFASSPAYRGMLGDARGAMADRFREVLVANTDVLEHDANQIYAKQGGAAVVQEALDSLPTKREELSVEFGPVIGRLYGFNFLAVQYREGEGLIPVALTRWGFKEDLPTVLVNYIGGALNAGNAAGFIPGGHYEVMVAGDIEETEDADRIVLGDDTTYIFPAGHELIEALMGLFPEVDLSTDPSPATSSSSSSSTATSSSSTATSTAFAQEVDPATAALLEAEGLAPAEAPEVLPDNNYLF
jgi:hypothetical protein